MPVVLPAAKSRAKIKGAPWITCEAGNAGSSGLRRISHLALQLPNASRARFVMARHSIYLVAMIVVLLMAAAAQVRAQELDAATYNGLIRTVLQTYEAGKYQETE